MLFYVAKNIVDVIKGLEIKLRMIIMDYLGGLDVLLTRVLVREKQEVREEERQC